MQTVTQMWASTFIPFKAHTDVVISSIHSLNVGEQSEVTLDLLHQFEHSAFVIRNVGLGPRVVVIQGQLGPDPGADWHLVALDVFTRTQFLLPSFTNATSEAPEVGPFTHSIPLN